MHVSPSLLLLRSGILALKKFVDGFCNAVFMKPSEHFLKTKGNETQKKKKKKQVESNSTEYAK